MVVGRIYHKDSDEELEDCRKELEVRTKGNNLIGTIQGE